MAKLVIDTKAKWVRPAIAIISTLVLMFIGYKVFITKEWKLDPDTERRLILVEEQNKRLKDSIAVIHKFNDSVGKVNDAKYANWKRKGIAFDNLKKKFDEERKANDNLSAVERVKLVSEWLNDD